MRTIERSTQFKRDYKRELKSHLGKKLETMLVSMLQILIFDQPLSEKYKDHALQGEYANCRDCHLAPDLVLIYKKVNNNVLQLIRLGSHSELF